MRMMMTGICVLALTLVAHAQEGLYWKQVSSGMENNQLFQGRFRPDTYRIFRLDEDLFGRMMEGRPAWMVNRTSSCCPFPMKPDPWINISVITHP